MATNVKFSEDVVPLGDLQVNPGTAGSLALEVHRARRDAFLVAGLRAAGAADLLGAPTGSRTT